MLRVAIALLLASTAGCASARDFLLGYLSQADDERYAAWTLQKAYPDAPGGRAAVAAQIALDDSRFALRGAGWSGAKLVAVEAADAPAIGAAIDQLVKQGVRHVVLELPAAGVAAAAAASAGKDLLLLNAAAPEDELRAGRCSPQLLHTLPSHAMQADALAQLLAARKWARPLVLHGPSPADRLLHSAFQRAARRFGIQPVAERGFKLSNDPRERDQGSVRLLTSDRAYDAVVVLDAAGEFAREVPYRAVLPRPVLGSNGLIAQAWSAFHERHGAPQLSRRFQKAAQRSMGSYDWAAWMAARVAAEVASADSKGTAAGHAKALRQGPIAFDGYKGQRLSFRAWDGQQRQPLLLAHGNGVAESAPLDGFLHPRSTLDTLGHDEPESACKTR